MTAATIAPSRIPASHRPGLATRWLVSLFAPLLCLLPVHRALAMPPRLVGYVTAKANPADIEAARLNALIFATAHIWHGRVTLGRASRQAFARLRALRSNDPRLKLLISVGGWKVGGFSGAALTAASRERFASSAVALLERMHADGLDVDWEYPGHHESGIVSRPSDRTHFTLLLRAIRRAMERASRTHPSDPRHYLLTAALADGPFVDHVQLRAVSRVLDWINLMTYDFNNSMTRTTGNHAGLYRSSRAGPGQRSVDQAVRQYLAAGVPARKILIGAAFYGRAFADARGRHHGLYQPYGTFLGTYAWPTLEHRYINHDGFRRYWDASADAAYLWNARSHTFISYDGPASLRAKVAYVISHHLGGIMYWEQSLDPDNQLFDVLANALHASTTGQPAARTPSTALPQGE